VPRGRAPFRASCALRPAEPHCRSPSPARHARQQGPIAARSPRPAPD
jgi:hypothetical protein